MNLELLGRYISEYENQFHRIHKLEIYKWQAVKQFQETWNPDAENFAAMLQLSLSKTRNLMAAAQYWPDRMIIANAEKNPSIVKQLFNDLFDEEFDVFERMAGFQHKIRELNSRTFPGKMDYQDERAMLVYLNLRYPDDYFFYKFKMFKDFCNSIEHDYVPKRGAKGNVAEYFYLCNVVRDEIKLNNQLLKLHKDRISKDEYFDAEYNILTQDFIYAVTSHLTVKEAVSHPAKPKLTFNNVNFDITKKEYKFSGNYVDYIAQQRRKKHIGDIGEQIVLQYEIDNCRTEFTAKIERVSRTTGDGMGFDILSFDNIGREKYIEVKTTKGPANRPFYITGSELARSRIEGENYFLYRLYNLDAENMTADCFIIHGDLSNYCINPTEYEVILKI